MIISLHIVWILYLSFYFINHASVGTGAVANESAAAGPGAAVTATGAATCIATGAQSDNTDPITSASTTKVLPKANTQIESTSHHESITPSASAPFEPLAESTSSATPIKSSKTTTTTTRNTPFGRTVVHETVSHNVTSQGSSITATNGSVNITAGTSIQIS